MGTPSLPQRVCHLSPQERNRFRQLRGKRVKETVMMASLASSKLLSRAALIEHWGELSRGSLAAAGGQGQSGLAGPCQPWQAVLSHPPHPSSLGSNRVLPWAEKGEHGQLLSPSAASPLSNCFQGHAWSWLCRYSPCSGCLIISELVAGGRES